MTPEAGISVLLTAAAAGAYGGLLGLGGGVLLVPALHLLFSVPMHAAVACSLAASSLVGGTAAARFAVEGRLHGPTVRRLYAGSLPAVGAGSLLGFHLPAPALRWGFAALLAWGVLECLLLRPAERREEFRVPEEVSRRPARTALAGGMLGLVAGLFGVGGGVAATPLQRALLGMPVKAAMAHSSAAMAGTCLFGSLVAGFLRAGAGDPVLPWSLLAWTAPGALLGSLAGSGLQAHLPSRLLLLVLAASLLWVAWKMVSL